ncbi:hypothetical protein GGQ62_001236 [Polymorphobacter fuscus]|nr:hypothetical protein [Polymorphobacter fuscus]
MRTLAIAMVMVAAPSAAQPALPYAVPNSAAPVAGAATSPDAATAAGPDAATAAGPDAAAQTAAEADATLQHAPKDGVTFAEDDVLGAAEEVFGKGAKGLAEIVQRSFKQYGQPNAYIVGREAGGAFVVGVRYGSGTLHHKIEGQRPVYWTGPSVGFDVGGDGSKVFALVYNLDDGEDLFRRYPAAEGKAYLVGGFAANYLQRDNVIIVPIKLGLGWRLGLNAGYLNFTKKGTANPF